MRRKILTGLGLAGALTLALAAPAFAQDVPTVADPGGSGLAQGMNLLWIVIGAVLVIFMQAGFALVETGFCRAKHAAHVVSTNFMIFGLGFAAYMAVGIREFEYVPCDAVVGVHPSHMHARAGRRERCGDRVQ